MRILVVFALLAAFVAGWILGGAIQRYEMTTVKMGEVPVIYRMDRITGKVMWSGPDAMTGGALRHMTPSVWFSTF